MSNKLAENLKTRLSALGMTQNTLAEKTGISQVMVHKLLSGKCKSTAKILDLAKALQCQPYWLLYGKDPTKPESNAEWVGDIEPWISGSYLRDDEVELPFFTEVELSAGTGSYVVQENHELKLRFPISALKKCGVATYDAYCIKVSGKSMVPVLQDGAIIGVDTASTIIKDGEMYALEHNGMLRVKLIYRVPSGGLRLRSFNSEEYPDEFYDIESIKIIRIIGRVFWYSVLR